MALLSIKDLRVRFEAGGTDVLAVDGLSLEIGERETVCLVGESGCGKTATALSIARLLPSPPARATGEIWLAGQNVLKMSPAELRQIRGGTVSYVFQEPGASLNPVMKVGKQILESLRQHQPDEATWENVVARLREVGIAGPERAEEYPHQLSGGMQQRVMLAVALACGPKLLVADEPTTALDVTVQAQVLELLSRLKEEKNLALLLITHNLALVSQIADRVAVMYAGQIVESGPARQVLETPLHPYTRALLESLPRLGTGGKRLVSLPGQVPSPGHWPAGCRLAPRCPIAREACFTSMPVLEERTPGRWVRCPFAEA